MKKKNITKRLIAIICIISMLVTSFYVSGPSAETALAAEDAATSQVTGHTELTNITLTDLGISKGTTKEIGVEYKKGFNNTILSFYDTISTSENYPRIHIGGRAGAKRQGLIFLIDASGNFIISGSTGYSGDTTNKLIFDTVTVTPGTVGLTSFFEQKVLIELQTEMTGNDVTFKVSLNKTLVATIELTDQANKLGNYLYFCDGTHNLEGYKEFAYSAESRYDFWTYEDAGGTDGPLSSTTGTNTLSGTLHGSYFAAKMTFQEGNFNNFYLGEGDWYGIAIVHSDDNASGLRFKTIATAEKLLCDITPEMVGKTTLRATEINLGVSVQFVDVDTSTQKGKLKVGIWIDGKLCGGDYFTSVEVSLAKCIKRVHTYAITGVSISSDVERPQYSVPQDFTQYTLADTTPTFSNVNVNTGEMDGYLPGDSLDRVLYSTWMKYTGDTQQFHYASSKTSTYGGITLYPDSSQTKIQLNRQAGDFDASTFAKMTFSAQDAIGQSAFDSEFLLQFTTEYVDSDFDGSKDDLKLGVWFNGKLYHSQYLYYVNGVEYAGMRVNANNSGLTMCSYYEELPETMKGYEEWSYNYMGFADQTTTNAWHYTDIMGETLSETMFTGYATFSSGSRYVLFGTARDSFSGIGFASDSSVGSISFGRMVSGSMSKYITISPSDYGLTTFKDEEVKLGVATRLLKVNDDGTLLVEAIPLVNDKVGSCKSWLFTISSTDYYKRMALVGDFTIRSTDCEARADDLPKNLTTVNMNDLGLEDTLTDWKGTGHYDKLSFDNTIIPLTVNFGTNKGQIRWGQQTGVSSYSGILLWRDGNNIKIGASSTNSTFNSAMGTAITVTPASVNMTSFENVDIDIDLVTQYIDFDYDGQEDDLKYGVYINDVLVNGKYIFVKDVVQYLGAGFHVHNDGGTIKKITTNGVTTKSLDEKAYTSYTLKDAGMKDGKGGSYGKLRAGKTSDGQYDYIEGAEYDKVLFGAKVKFADAAARINYASPLIDTSTSAGGNPHDGITIRLYESDTTKLRLQKLAGTLTYDSVNIDAAQFDLDTFAGQEFKLQLTTNVVDLDSEGEANDVQLGIWINGELANNKYVNIFDQAASLNCYVNFNEGANTEYYSLWDIEAPANKDTQYYKMDEAHPYLVVADSLTNDVTKAVHENGTEVSASGDYTAQYAAKDELQQATQSVVLWKEWDCSADGEYNVKDIIALKKAGEGIELSTEAGQMAASKIDSATSLSELRQYVVGKVTELSTSVAAISYDTDADGLVMPIGAWIAPSNWNGYNNAGSLIYMTDFGMETNFLQKKYYDMIQELGINVLTYNADDYNGNSQNAILKSLAFAEQYNLKAYVQDSGVADDITSKTDLAKRINLYSRYSSFAGLNVYDEPCSDYFTYSGSTSKNITEIKNKALLLNKYSNLLGYVNLYPDYNQDGSLDGRYEGYLETYIKNCNPTVLSYDDYPFADGESVENCEWYFNNLAIIRNYASDANIPFIGYIGTGEDYTQNVTSTTNTLPTNEQLKWNVNTLLAYGAKGYNWFTLIQPWYMAMTGTDGAFTGMDFNRLGLIGADGSKTRNYNAAKEVNAWVGKIDSILMEAESVDILAKGTYAQSNTNIAKVTYDNMTLNVEDATYGAIVGVFTYHGKTVYYVVNNNVTTAQTITLGFGTETPNLTVYNGENKTSESTNSCALSIAAGGAALVVVE